MNKPQQEDPLESVPAGWGAPASAKLTEVQPEQPRQRPPTHSPAPPVTYDVVHVRQDGVLSGPWTPRQVVTLYEAGSFRINAEVRGIIDGIWTEWEDLGNRLPHFEELSRQEPGAVEIILWLLSAIGVLAGVVVLLATRDVWSGVAGLGAALHFGTAAAILQQLRRR